jgi:hypothetical protein
LLYSCSSRDIMPTTPRNNKKNKNGGKQKRPASNRGVTTRGSSPPQKRKAPPGITAPHTAVSPSLETTRPPTTTAETLNKGAADGSGGSHQDGNTAGEQSGSTAGAAKKKTAGAKEGIITVMGQVKVKSKYCKDKPRATLTQEQLFLLKSHIGEIFSDIKFFTTKEKVDCTDYLMDFLFSKLGMLGNSTSDRLTRCQHWNALEETIFVEINKLRSNKITSFNTVVIGE